MQDIIKTVSEAPEVTEELVDVTEDTAEDHEASNFSVSDSIEKLYKLHIISRKTFATLYVEPLKTIEEIIYIPKAELSRIPNMGDKSITEIVEFINNYPIQGRITCSRLGNVRTLCSY